MRRLAPVSLLLAAAAWAGQTSRTTYGSASQAVPTAATPPTSQGVSLAGAVGCRMSIYVDGGGNILAGCKLVPWYYDNGVTGWTEADSTLHCTTTALQDGGARDAFVCPDMVPAARFGRVAVQKVYCTGADGGTGSRSDPDAGILIQPFTRIECWGPNVTP